ncbi:MAG: universal stress protein, partial [candidate division WOR-3 bacterium]|nr:universal stress protein [candidate division WOR-3 bacterium]
VVAYGLAADEIVRVAEENNVDLIVIATHGRTGFRHLISGSVTEKVVRIASHPVLTIRIPRKTA